MGQKNKTSLDEDECLAIEVRKYPCLYNKKDGGFKDMAKKGNKEHRDGDDRLE